MLAAVVRLLEATLIRVGNEEYARDNGSFGLTTLRDRHASIKGSTVKFRFRGKSGKVHEIGVQDRRLSRIVKQLPGAARARSCSSTSTARASRRAVTSSDVNDYLREITGQEFTAKDFRTWAGTVLAAWALQELEGRAHPGGGEEATSSARWRGWPGGSATPWPSAASATCTPWSSTPTSTAR